MKITRGRIYVDEHGVAHYERWEEDAPDTSIEDDLRASMQIPAPTQIIVPKWVADAINKAVKRKRT